MASLDLAGYFLGWGAFVNVFVAPLLAYWLLWIVYARTFHPLAKIPGPLWASTSRTWLMYRMYLGDLEIHQRALHERSVLH
jgi:hypothetical protein